MFFQKELRIEQLGKKKGKEEEAPTENKNDNPKEGGQETETKASEEGTDADKKEKKVSFVLSFVKLGSRS